MITVYELLAILRKHGFKEINKHGNYHKFSDVNGRIIIFSYLNRHDMVPNGTYQAILKQIN